MYLLEQCRVATQSYVRNKYYKYLRDNKQDSMTRCEIIQFTNNTLDTRRSEVTSHIISQVKRMNRGTNIDEIELLNMLNEIIDDRQLLCNRICLEIENHQNSKKSNNCSQRGRMGGRMGGPQGIGMMGKRNMRL